MKTLEKGFKFRDDFYNTEIVSKMNYNDQELLIKNVNEEINVISDVIAPYSDSLKVVGKEGVPEHIVKKLKYKDALIYFVRDLKESIFFKSKDAEKRFVEICRDRLSVEDFEEIWKESLGV
jgi:hypothetical protein